LWPSVADLKLIVYFNSDVVQSCRSKDEGECVENISHEARTVGVLTQEELVRRLNFPRNGLEWVARMHAEPTEMYIEAGQGEHIELSRYFEVWLG
jgi:hypothetical protein